MNSVFFFGGVGGGGGCWERVSGVHMHSAVSQKECLHLHY